MCRAYPTRRSPLVVQGHPGENVSVELGEVAREEDTAAPVTYRPG